MDGTVWHQVHHPEWVPIPERAAYERATIDNHRVTLLAALDAAGAGERP